MKKEIEKKVNAIISKMMEANLSHDDMLLVIRNVKEKLKTKICEKEKK